MLAEWGERGVSRGRFIVAAVGMPLVIGSIIGDLPEACGGQESHPYLRNSSGHPLVVVMEATKHGPGNDPAGLRWPSASRGPRWSLQAQ